MKLSQSTCIASELVMEELGLAYSIPIPCVYDTVLFVVGFHASSAAGEAGVCGQAQPAPG